MKNLLKTLVVVAAIIIVAKTGLGYAQNYICTKTENEIEYQVNSNLGTMSNLMECKVNCEFTDPLTMQISSCYEDRLGNQWEKNTQYVSVIDILFE